MPRPPLTLAQAAADAAAAQAEVIAEPSSEKQLINPSSGSPELFDSPFATAANVDVALDARLNGAPADRRQLHQVLPADRGRGCFTD